MSPTVTEAATRANERRIAKGTVIFRQGDAGDDMFVVVAGRVRLTLDVGGDVKEVAVFGTGEFFGELSALTGAPRTATAEAIDDTTLLVIDRDAFGMLVQDDLEIVYRMMRTQSRRLSLANEPIQQFGRKLGRIRVVAQFLRQMRGGTALPCKVAVSELAAGLQASPELVSATVAELVATGGGMLVDDEWSVDRPEQVDRLIDALCRYAKDDSA